jgi:hypothetical protein
MFESSNVLLNSLPAAAIVPIFRDSGFDAEETRALGEAYDIACRSLHPTGPPPVVQQILARKIIDLAQRGERDPDRLAANALTNLGPFYRDVIRRFGLIPNFFMSAPDAPEIVEKLWNFAQSAYLDNPIPSLFKERLFVFLSRFCPVRYCIVRHCGFLVGYGHHRAMLRLRHKASSRRSSFSRRRRRGGESSSRFMQAWQPSKSPSIGPPRTARLRTGSLPLPR